MMRWGWIAVLAALVAGCSLLASSEEKMLWKYIEAMNALCDKVEAARTEAELKKAMEWGDIKVKPMALELRSMEREDPESLGKAMENEKLRGAWQKGILRVASVMKVAQARFGGEGNAALETIMSNMQGKTPGSKAAPSPAPSSTALPKTKTWRPPPTIADVRRGHGQVGVDACDKLLKNMRACADKVPGFKRQELLDQSRQWADTWITSGRTFAGRRALARICKRQRAQKTTELGKYGCKF